MKNLLFIIFPFCLFSFLNAQTTIDSGFAFQTESFKSYHLYIPSAYNENEPHQLMLALHPFNTSRWDGESWRDTLITFAETNNLILVSPDGGSDGKIDDPIDTAFTSFLIDSMSIWYNIDESERYIMGFSWGGRTTYTYGLDNVSEYKGFMPIGAAASIDQIQNSVGNASDKPFYLVHGSQDSPNVRYTPFLNALNDNDACVESLLMSGVGHTIDFPNRNQILSDAFSYLKNETCPLISSTKDIDEQSLEVLPNPNEGVFSIKTLNTLTLENLQVFTIGGQKVAIEIDNQYVRLLNYQPGMFIVTHTYQDQKQVSRIFVR